MVGPHPSVAPLPLPAFPLPLGLQKLHPSSPLLLSSPSLSSAPAPPPQSCAAATELGLSPSIRRLATSRATPTFAEASHGDDVLFEGEQEQVYEEENQQLNEESKWISPFTCSVLIPIIA
ncbi:uncharacterized protein LOC120639250 [Panicum virgatum]|uniref:uncharacterized protein LOC120639250 n=1 Tax=Panicum virgatum TaxID=38727 RepID=UPI0019D65EEC|nr:uncharacterized protein LOC120639250 [Panicum virgatum]